MNTLNRPLKVFITYSHRDKEAKDTLISYLDVMKQEGLINIWHDNEILPSDRWRDVLFSNLEDSDILLYLTSHNSLASESCNEELSQGLNEERNRKIKPLPIILEACDWQNHPLSEFQVLPTHGQPINEWQPVNTGWNDVVQGIRRIIKAIQSSTPPPSSGSENGHSSDPSGESKSTLQRGNFQWMIKQATPAIASYTDAINRNPNYTEAYKQRGILYFTQERYELALADFSMIIELDPENIEAYELYCLVNEHTGAYTQALLGYNRAISMDPENTRLFFNRGRIHTLTNDREQALLDYNKTIELDPEYAKAYFMLGAHYRESSEYDLAFENLNKTIKLDPKDPHAYYERALIHRQKGEYDLALVNLDKTIELDPKDNEFYFQRALTYLKINEYDLALQDLDTAIELAPERDNLHFHRGEVLRLLSVSE